MRKRKKNFSPSAGDKFWHGRKRSAKWFGMANKIIVWLTANLRRRWRNVILMEILSTAFPLICDTLSVVPSEKREGTECNLFMSCTVLEATKSWQNLIFDFFSSLNFPYNLIITTLDHPNLWCIMRFPSRINRITADGSRTKSCEVSSKTCSSLRKM